MSRVQRFFRAISNPLDNEQGSVVVMTLTFLVILSLLGIYAVRLTQNEQLTVRNYEEGLRAFYQAEGNLHKAIAELVKAPSEPKTISGTQVTTLKNGYFQIVSTASAGGITKTVRADVQLIGAGLGKQDDEPLENEAKNKVQIKVLVTNWSAGM